MPLHIPPHVREGRSRRLSEPLAADDFGNFAFKNLPVLEKANKDVIQKLRAEAMQAQSKPPTALNSPSVSSPTPSLESSPLLPMPLQRAISQNKGNNRPTSPSVSQSNSSPSRASQPSSPLLVSFSTGQNHERRKTSSGSSTLSHQTSNSLQPGSFFDPPRLSSNAKAPSNATSPIKIAKTPGQGHERGLSIHRHSSISQSSSVTSPRNRSQTLSSQEGDVLKDLVPSHHKRRSQVFDISPSSSDNEDSRQKALLRVQRRRQSSRRLSQITLADGPVFRPLDVLVCEDHPVSRLVMEKLLEKLRCCTITVQTGPEAIRYAMSEVKFDIIMMEFRLPQINGADVARMIRETKNANSNTPIVAVTGYLKELLAPHHFDALIEKPPTLAKLTEVMGRLCQWKAAPPNWTPSQLPLMMSSALRQQSSRTEDSPTSNSSGFAAMPSGSYRGSSREDSISSSFFGDNESRTDDVSVIISRQSTEDWHERELARAMGGLGISAEPGPEIETKAATQPIPYLAPTSHPLPAELHPQTSAPAVMDHPPPTPLRKKRSAEPAAKRRSLEARRYECAESGDDEDEELGDVQVRARSPRTRPKPSSKLGVEMMRTNSHGSVVSVEDLTASDVLPASPPPVISEDRVAEEKFALEAASEKQPPTLTPPEIFPQVPSDEVQDIDMDATPKPHHTGLLDPDPTPKPLRRDLEPPSQQ